MSVSERNFEFHWASEDRQDEARFACPGETVNSARLLSRGETSGAGGDFRAPVPDPVAN